MIGLLVLLVIVGVVLYLIPMDAGIKRIIVAVVALLVVLCLLQGFGLFSGNFGHWGGGGWGYRR